MDHRRTVATAVAGLTATLGAVVATGTPVAAKGDEVVKRGACTAVGDWKVKVGAEDGNRLELELEIEDGRPGAVWTIAVGVNRTRVLTAIRRANTVGDVRLERVVQGRRGPDRVAFVATTRGTRCQGAVVL